MCWKGSVRGCLYFYFMSALAGIHHLLFLVEWAGPWSSDNKPDLLAR
jgi:hypothetical protein